MPPLPLRPLRKGAGLRMLVVMLVFFAAAGSGTAQQKGEPGKFDFYLLNIVPSTQFCAIKDVGKGCVTKPGWMLHGLWAQNFDGTYPVFCSERPGPRHPENDLDITPDPQLLKHEWAKHGTCTTLAPAAFFREERKAFYAFHVPSQIAALTAPVVLSPGAIVAEFEQANPNYPHGSVIVWCSEKKLTSVSACLSKELKPIECRGLRTCADAAITIEPVR